MRAAWLAVAVLVLLAVAMTFVAVEGPVQALGPTISSDERSDEATLRADLPSSSHPASCRQARNDSPALTGCPDGSTPVGAEVGLGDLRRAEAGLAPSLR